MQQPRQLATWNPDRDLWETDQLSIFGPLVAYSETLPRSGMTRDGRLYELPTSAHPTTAHAFSSSPALPTPAACNPNDGEHPESWLARRERVSETAGNGNGMGTPLAIAVQLLPTPKGRDGKSNDGEAELELLPTPTVGNATGTNERRGGARGGEMLLPGVAVAAATGGLLPTPKASDSKSNDGETERRRKAPAMSAVSHYFPTPAASDATGGGTDPANREGHTGQIDAVLDADLWGKYAPAITRWEQITRPAPAPTEPNSNGRPRLVAAFAEWMMGLPAGHVTSRQIGIGQKGVKKRLSRIAQLKAIGNGVCPQQALAALAILDPRQAA